MFRVTSLLWLTIPYFCLSLTYLNALLWDGDELILGFVPSQCFIWGVIQDSLNLSSELLGGSPL